jgi:hypothetical protein
MLGLVACNRASGATHDDAQGARSNDLARQVSTGTYVDRVDARCAELDHTKTAIYHDALADSRLTIPEYLIAQGVYAKEARSFDADVAKIPMSTPAEAHAQAVLTAYKNWVEKRRQSLDALAAKGDETGFETALEQSNVGFAASPQVQAMRTEGFITACLSR